ncbi:MAG: single-stranded DNA-binding protein [Verrucomicrobiota bacterium]
MLEINEYRAIGNLGKDPEISYLASGTPVCKFTLAVNRSWKNQQGSYDQATTWLNVECWNKTAEFAGKYLAKGNRIYISGRLDQSDWTNEDGQKKSRLYVTASQIQFAERKDVSQEQQGNGQPPQQRQQQAFRPQATTSAKPTEMLDDLPLMPDDLPF